jgi:hypothetical protein
MNINDYKALSAISDSFMKLYGYKRSCLALSFGILVLGSSCNFTTQAPSESQRLNAVKIFAENVFASGSDRWSGQATPLLADGINILTGEPVEWIYEGEHYIIHNLASQQNLFRTLTGLSNITGDEQYRKLPGMPSAIISII